MADPDNRTNQPPRSGPTLTSAREATTTHAAADLAAAAAGAHAARAWAESVRATQTPEGNTPVPAPSASPASAPSGESQPDHTACTSEPTPEARAATDARRNAATVEHAIRRHADALVAAAWHRREPGAMAVAPALPPLPAASGTQRGTVTGHWRTGRYTGRRALVCLGCGWVGTLVPVLPGRHVPDAAEAAAHTCPTEQA